MNTRIFLVLGTAVWALVLPSCIDPALLGPPTGNSYGYGRPAYEDGYRDRGRYVEGSRDRYYRPREPRYDIHTDHRDHNSRNDRWGGAEAWFKSGYGLGKRDRKLGMSRNPRRHSNHYDGRTYSRFEAGYLDGYR